MTYPRDIDPNTDPAILSRRERKKLNQQYAIIRAALDLFREKGYDETAVSEIAEKADISYTTFFNYFPTKESLLSAIQEMEIKDLAEVADLRFEGESSIEVVLEGVFKEWVFDSLNNRNTIVRVQESLMHQNGAPFLTPIEQLLRSIVIHGIENGDFKKDTDPQLISVLLSGLHDALVINRREDLLDSGFEAIIAPVRA
ncbi:MAG: TetR/AcrR family transcriptional regulator [Clostridiales bacterium]|nr:TetR/AcrR family transcriptional regulator [Clostridiales bacterium]